MLPGETDRRGMLGLCTKTTVFNNSEQPVTTLQCSYHPSMICYTLKQLAISTDVEQNWCLFGTPTQKNLFVPIYGRVLWLVFNVTPINISFMMGCRVREIDLEVENSE